MAKYEAGFIGAGNMGGALALAAAKKTGGDRIAVACSTRERSEAAAQRLGCTAETPQRILSDSRFVFLGVKPQMVVGVVEGLKADILASEGIFVSMLAGVSLEKLALLLGADKKIIRIMPNTPCAVGQGLILYAANGRVSEDELCAFRELMAPAGALDELNEHLIDAASAVSGCGPAYAYLFIEALADGGVKNGLPRAKAQRYAAQMLLGSAEMVLRTGRHPGQLKDEVCSPGGSTIAGVAALERSGLRSACIEAVDAAVAMGAKLVWMPTVSALRHKIMHSGKGVAFPASKGMSVAEKPIMYLQEDGSLQPQVLEVLDYLAAHPDVILATGHGSRDEIDALIHAAVERGVQRILVNHPHYMIGASLEDMVAWSRLGAYIELNAVAFVPDSKFHSNEIEEARNIVAAVGLDKIVADSDYGQNGNGSPVQGLLRFISMLQEACGLTQEQMEVMTYHNPAWLLGLETR